MSERMNTKYAEFCISKVFILHSCILVKIQTSLGGALRIDRGYLLNSTSINSGSHRAEEIVPILKLNPHTFDTNNQFLLCRRPCQEDGMKLEAISPPE